MIPLLMVSTQDPIFFVPLKPIVILLSTPLPAVLPKIILVPPVPPLDIAPVVTALAGMSLPTMA